MHLPDGLLDLKTTVATAAVAAVGTAVALRRLEASLGERAAPLLGTTAAFVFAAQMVNFPIAAGTSGHLIGGVLAAVLLGPWGGLVVMTIVLLVQSLLFGDGGLLALGANVLNQGVIGSAGGYCIYMAARRLLPSKAGPAPAAVVAAWFAVLLAATACSLELAWSGVFPLWSTLPAMLTVHLAIGGVEALATGLAVAFINQTRPDLIYDQRLPATPRSHAPVVVGGLAIALVLAVFLSPWASELPDGLEWSIAHAGSIAPPAPRPPETPVLPAPIPEYQFPGLESAMAATSIAGLVGTALVFLVAATVSSSGPAGRARKLANV